MPEDAEIIHLNDLNVLSGVLGGRASRRRHFRNLIRGLGPQSPKRLIFTDHGVIHFTPARQYAWGHQFNHFGFISRIVRSVSWFAASRADVIIANSDNHQTTLHDIGIPSHKTRRVYHGVSKQFINSEPTDVDDPFVLHVSSHGGKKNPDVVFDIARTVCSKVFIVGNGWSENAPPEVAEDRTIVTPGHVSQDRLIELYNRASGFYMPSLYETFCLPIAEAMSCGTPVVGSTEYAVPEIIGDAGVTHPANDMEGFVDSLNRLVQDGEWRRWLESNAVNRGQEFSWERTARETYKVYQSVLEQPNSV